jgi:hypothetical protein
MRMCMVTGWTKCGQSRQTVPWCKYVHGKSGGPRHTENLNNLMLLPLHLNMATGSPVDLIQYILSLYVNTMATGRAVGLNTAYLDNLMGLSLYASMCFGTFCGVVGLWCRESSISTDRGESRGETPLHPGLLEYRLIIPPYRERLTRTNRGQK